MILPFTIYDLRFTICRKSEEFSAFNHQSSIINHKFRRAFTIIELLTVLGIMAVLAALAVPALKNFGRADAMTAATQQMLNDVSRARQLAISRRTTVYMVFVPTNFWQGLNTSVQSEPATTNLCDKQMTGYTFASYGAVGDQPGQHLWHYLAPWQALPEGACIAEQKFNQGTWPNAPYTVTDPFNNTRGYNIYGFNLTNSLPFPTETNSVPVNYFLPYIAFNYLGQLTDDGQTMAARHEYIPLARANIVPGVDAETKTFQLRSPQVIESPPGNSTNAYNIIDIDPLTGRATLQQPKMQ
ncbi:MAG TPA: prepilin-type N-terminal cleavage/methylation domain-containing protein [Candidatus Acidoferrales bacterium]|nr:prepilin-type N-terminal cleavage/methylation domain-containing protein [Candidatus Acidoferrales bacterium]